MALAATLLLLALAPAELPAEEHELVWNDEWPRVDGTDYALTLGAWATVGATRLFLPATGAWKDSVLFDDAFFDLLTSDDIGAQRTAGDWSDALQIGLILYPHVVDIGIVALGARQNLDVAHQMLVINLESMGVALAISELTKAMVGRVRPQVDACDPAGQDYTCRSQSNRRSLPSGHSTAAFTSAGLICAHQQHLKLYGSTAAAAIACGAGVALATITGGLRIAANRHYATDVVAGAIIGGFAGYALPKLLHYDRSTSEAEALEGPVRGYAELDLVLGMLSGPNGSEVAVGARLGARHIVPLTEETWGLEFAAFGQAIRGTESADSQLLTLDTRLWFSHVSAGPFLRYVGWRSDGDVGPRVSGVVVGPSIAFGFFGRSSLVLLSGRWGPMIDQGYEEFSGRLELAWFEYVTVGVEGQGLLPYDHTRKPISIFVTSLGGRLPW